MKWPRLVTRPSRGYDSETTLWRGSAELTTQVAEQITYNDVYTHSFKPRFYEIDSQGIMFNMWYLGYVDEAMDGYFAHRGVPYSTWAADLGIDGHVAHVELDWKGAIGWHDNFEVLVSPSRIGNKSLTLDFAFRRGHDIGCIGSIVYVLFATDGSGTAPLPPAVIEALGEVRPLRPAQT
jgi:acyl-CoA thioester hydrolase